MADKVEQIRKAVARLRAASAAPTTVVRSTKGDKGDRGERGEKGTSFRWRGQVRKGMGFSPNDVVHYKGAAYLCLAVTTDPPPSDSWAVMCKAEDGRDGRDGAQGAVGPQGEQGVQGPQGEAGADGLRWRGAYSQGQRYEIGDVVGYEGGAFVCVAATVQPPVTGSGWQVLAEAGKTGPRGPKGERGADGTGGGGGAVDDGDYGDITVSGSGLVWTIDDGTITPVKISTGGPQWTTTGEVTIDVGATANPNNALLIKSDNPGASAAPDLVLYRNSASPAASDVLGRIRFKGNDEAANDEVYANIHAQISDATAGLIDGQLHFSVHVDGDATERVKITEAASATSTTAASVVVTGGIGVSGAAFIGGVGNVAGVMTAANTTESISTSTGGLVCSGGIGAAKAVRGGNDSFFNSVRVGRGASNLSNNTAIGESALSNIGSTGTQQTAIGKNALFVASTGSFNTGIGYQALYNNQAGSSNTAIGANALFSCQGGTLNLANGLNALYNNVSGNYNIGLGVNALFLATGSNNIAIGVNALDAQTTTNDNTAIGYQAGSYVTDPRNVFIGKGAGNNASDTASTRATTSQECVFIGAHAHPSGTGDDNSVVIGYNSTGDGSNTTVIGNASATQARVRGATLLSTGANGQSTSFAQATALVSTPSGATVTSTNLIPANSIVLGVTVRVTTAVTGATTFDVGDGTTANRFADDVAVASGTTSQLAIAPALFAAATNVVLTANGSNFTGGAVRVTVHYITLVAPTS